MELQSRTIIVTGAAGGIGSVITAACARQGARVAAVDRVEAVAPSGEGIPAEAVTPFLADLSESAGCTDLLAEVTDRLGAVDGLVNCAGVMRRGDLLEIDEDDWAATYAVNVDAVMRLCRAALPLLKKAGSAAIVNIASQWGAAAGRRTHRVQQFEGRGGLAHPQSGQGLRGPRGARELDLPR
jgi:NAD(P)-dependent dehydrogenase (short-subunit alcohol dehydrogenase family)